jgi:hypothetical protein
MGAPSIWTPASSSTEAERPKRTRGRCERVAELRCARLRTGAGPLCDVPTWPALCGRARVATLSRGAGRELPRRRCISRPAAGSKGHWAWKTVPARQFTATDDPTAPGWRHDHSQGELAMSAARKACRRRCAGEPSESRRRAGTRRATAFCPRHSASTWRHDRSQSERAMPQSPAAHQRSAYSLLPASRTFSVLSSRSSHMWLMP